MFQKGDNQFDTYKMHDCLYLYFMKHYNFCINLSKTVFRRHLKQMCIHLTGRSGNRIHLAIGFYYFFLVQFHLANALSPNENNIQIGLPDIIFASI